MSKKHVNVAALFATVDSKRSAGELSWRELASELEIHASVFTRMGQGSQPDADTLVTIADWLGVDLSRFVEGEGEKGRPITEDTVAVISTYLRADRALKPKSADAIEAVLRAAYEQFAEKK